MGIGLAGRQAAAKWARKALRTKVATLPRACRRIPAARLHKPQSTQRSEARAAGGTLPMKPGMAERTPYLRAT